MSISKPIQLGLCCLNTTLRTQKPTVFASRSIILRTLHEQGVDFLKEKILQNLQDLLVMIEWNEQHGIKVFRLSSGLFPHKSNVRAQDYSLDFAQELLTQIGSLAKKYNQRLTFHPGQYNVIGSPHEKVVESTTRDLLYHAEVLDALQAPPDSVMVIHGGGTYGDKEATKERWCENYLKMPDPIRRRLVLENCEKNFSIEDCLEISEKVHVPVVFDTHHYTCYNILHPTTSEFTNTIKPAEEYIARILATWTRRHLKPKFHVSEQGSGKCGHHSDYIEEIPEYLLEIPEKYGIEIDIMIEAKKKELAIFRLYEKYPQLNCKIIPQPKDKTPTTEKKVKKVKKVKLVLKKN